LLVLSNKSGMVQETMQDHAVILLVFLP
jgi:hypothetical protein